MSRNSTDHNHITYTIFHYFHDIFIRAIISIGCRLHLRVQVRSTGSNSDPKLFVFELRQGGATVEVTPFSQLQVRVQRV